MSRELWTLKKKCGAVGPSASTDPCVRVGQRRKMSYLGSMKTGIFETRRKGLLLQFPAEGLAVQGKRCHQHLGKIEKKDSLNDWEAPPPTGDGRRHFASSNRGRWQRVLITLMDRNINTVKKLSSVPQIKAIKPSREKPKVEVLRLDINHTQQWGQLTTHNSTPRNMKLSVSLEIFTWFFSFPGISAPVLEGINSGKSCDLCYPRGQKSQSQWSHLVLSSIAPRGSELCVLPAQLPVSSTRGGLIKTGWSRRGSGVLFVSFQLWWGF